MPPFAWGGDAVLSMVHVDALAEGLCLATANAPIGEDYLFCGEPLSIRGLFEIWGRHPGGMVPRLWLPRSLMYWQMALLEPLQRMLGLPAFLSRETVEVTKAHLNYSSAKRSAIWAGSIQKSKKCGSVSLVTSAGLWPAVAVS
jgi:dihydroflavonol-4-reductase